MGNVSTPRVFEMVPVSMPDGSSPRLSPGKHNAVEAAIIEQFAPRFAPGAVVLYLGGSTDMELASAQSIMTELGIPLDQHDKLPKAVLWDHKRNWLFLIEAAITHGPMSPKRVIELNKLLQNVTAGRVFVSIFSDMDEFNDHLENIAWKSHVWLVDIPDHMIHLD